MHISRKSFWDFWWPALAHRKTGGCKILRKVKGKRVYPLARRMQHQLLVFPLFPFFFPHPAACPHPSKRRLIPVPHPLHLLLLHLHPLTQISLRRSGRRPRGSLSPLFGLLAGVGRGDGVVGGACEGAEVGRDKLMLYKSSVAPNGMRKQKKTRTLLRMQNGT